MLCVLVLIASLDRVPDPPSIKPDHSAAASLSVGIHDLRVADQGHVPDLAPVRLSDQAQSVYLRFIPADKPLLQSATYLGHAADSSPPFSAS